MPVLIRRIALEHDPELHVVFPRPPQRAQEGRLLKPGELERRVDFAGRTVAPGGGVLVLLDCDDGCPAELGPSIQARARAALRPDVALSVVLAKREYETWFLAAAPSLRGQRGLATDLGPPSEPEGIRDAKGWLTDHMTAGRTYQPARDQAALSSTFDFSMARAASASFEVCYRHVVDLLDAAGRAPPAPPATQSGA